MKEKALKAIQPQKIIETYQYGDFFVNVFDEGDGDISIWIMHEYSCLSLFVTEVNPISFFDEGIYKYLSEFICNEMIDVIDSSILEYNKIIEWYNSDILKRMQQGTFYE